MFWSIASFKGEFGAFNNCTLLQAVLPGEKITKWTDSQRGDWEHLTICLFVAHLPSKAVHDTHKNIDTHIDTD